MWFGIAVLLVLLPLAHWQVRARSRSVGLAVGVPLVAWAALVLLFLLDAVELRNRGEFYALYLPVAALLVGLGSVVERLRLGPRTKQRLQGRARAIVVGFRVELLLGLPLALLLSLITVGEAEVPSASAAPALPPGFSAVTVGEGCGNGHHATCGRTLEVTAPPGLTREQARRLLPIGDHRCEPYGWLIDRRDFCVLVEESGGRIEIVLTMSGR